MEGPHRHRGVPGLRWRSAARPCAPAIWSCWITGAHKNEATLALITATGAQVRFLPAYSPDLNPIEMMWSKVKAFLRAAQARTHEPAHRPRPWRRSPPKMPKVGLPPAAIVLIKTL
ncbi:MAG: transposase [Opitutaceae bacterium]|nr:transposase [Opitutaceae bacterium]